MTATEFTLKWEEEIQHAKAMWEFSCEKGSTESELIEGARMQGTAKMIEDFYDTFKIMPPHIRRMKDAEKRFEAEGWINPEKE